VDGEVVVTSQPSRDLVMDFEASLKAFTEKYGCGLDAEKLTRHWFAPGIYARELLIPAGTCLTGKIHRGAHLNIISAGRISVLTEHGIRTLEAPCTLVSDAGIKRVGFAHTDTVWTCIHANHDDCRDLVQLEARYIAPSFEAIEGATAPDKLEVIL
jgi:hypothetical protein